MPASTNLISTAEIKTVASNDGPLEPTSQLLEELAEQSTRLEAATPVEIIRWAVETFGRRLTMGTAFGPEGMCILYWLAQVGPDTHVFNLDTGYQFQETLELRDQVAQRYGIEVELRRGVVTMKVIWPLSATADFSAWTRELLR